MIRTPSTATSTTPPVRRALVLMSLLMVAACFACSRAAPETEPEPEPEPAETASPFALEIKEVVLRRFLERLDDKLGPGYLYVLSDEEHGEALVQLLHDVAIPLTNHVLIAMEEGAVVAYDTRQPVAMCTLVINAWTRDDAEVTGVWYASAELEGEKPFHVVWRAPHWRVVEEEEEL